MDTVNLEIGLRLQNVRKNNKKTQSDIAKALKVTRSTVSKYERGALSITPDSINRLCKLYKINHTWLLTGKGLMSMDDKKTELSSKINSLPTKTKKAITDLVNSLIK